MEYGLQRNCRDVKGRRPAGEERIIDGVGGLRLTGARFVGRVSSVPAQQ